MVNPSIDSQKLFKCLDVSQYILLIYCILAGSVLFLANPGLYWDDWVWAFKTPDEAFAVGRELGIWWGGYATNLINSLENPGLAMRFFAWGFWLLAGFFFSKALYQEKIISKDDSFWVFLMCATTYLATIRYLISTSFYNAYIAFFWCGLFLLTKGRISKKIQLIAAPLLFFSFYLNFTQ